MGHDILAGQDLDTDAITERLSQLAWTPVQWEHRLDNFPHVAHLRRSAYDVLGKVIYRALGAEDLYGGASGVGEKRSFSRLQISIATKLLPSIVVDTPPPIDTQQVDEMGEMLGVTDQSPEQETGVEEEAEFLETIDDWMAVTDASEVEIYFG